MSISIIAAVDQNMGLGKKNQLLCHLPADLRYFKEQTINKPIIMGYNTFLSIGKALPHRRNFVLTSRQLKEVEGIHFVTDFTQALTACDDEDEIMIIGGAQVYQQAMSFVSKIYLTIIAHQFEADVFFPNIAASQWHKTSQSHREKDENNRYDMDFTVWERL